MPTKLKDIPIDQRVKLVEDLWDTIAVEQRELQLTEEQRRHLDERLNRYELDIDPGEHAHIVIERIRQSL